MKARTSSGHCWWHIDGNAYHHECIVWRERQKSQLARAIVVTRRTDIGRMRRVVDAFLKMFESTGGAP